MKAAVNIVAAIALLVLVISRARAASLTTEPFTAGFNGWTNGINPDTWVATNQLLRISLPGSFTPPSATLEGGPGASVGTFTGDYTASGIEAVGFSFLCESVKPSDLIIELRSGTNTYSQELAPRLGAVGSWNYFLCPLSGPDSGRWAGFFGGGLSGVLTNVDRVTIRVLASGVFVAQAYQLDDLFLDRLPAATSLATTGTNITEVTWANLRTNFTYRMEYTASPTNSWSALAAFVATNTAHNLTHTNATPDAPAFYRLFAP